jgi:uncharacterized protein (DUF58 family)
MYYTTLDEPFRFSKSQAMTETDQALSTDIYARISSLKIQARNLVEGLLSGLHRSRHKGSSVEFAEYKDYTPGDEIRHIDWKVVGKTDKYHIKQFEQSTNLKCHILLDASGSMGYESTGGTATGMSKMDYARTLAGALSYLLLKQFDAVGLLLFNDSIIEHIPARSKPSHFQHILHRLASLDPQGTTRLDQALRRSVEVVPNRSMMIIISDLLTQEETLIKNLKLVQAQGIEVILFHILHPDEMKLPFEGEINFESLEEDPSLTLDPVDVQKAYQELIKEHIEFYKRNCPALGVDYLFMETGTPLEQALTYYLLRRKSLKK